MCHADLSLLVKPYNIYCKPCKQFCSCCACLGSLGPAFPSFWPLLSAELVAIAGISLQRFQVSTPTGKLTAASYMRLMLNGVTSMITELCSVCFALKASQNNCNFEPCVAYSNSTLQSDL